MRYNAVQRKSLIAHELGHALMGFLYEIRTRPGSISLKPEEDGTMASCAFFEYESPSIVADYNLARLAGISYLGGIFGEMLLKGKFYVLGVRTDLDEFLGVNRQGRKSRSKLVDELFSWFYTDTDDMSFNSRMQLYFDDPRAFGYGNLTVKQVELRLPLLWQVYCKFLGHIDPKAFISSVEELTNKDIDMIQQRVVTKHCKRIITALDEELLDEYC